MSDAAVYEGYARVAAVPDQGMITIRGDLTDDSLTQSVQELCGCACPGTGQISASAHRSLAWMAPDELLLVLPQAEVKATAESLAQALKPFHSLVVDVSDARAIFEVTGHACREVVAKLAPVDLHPVAFGPGDFRRTRLAQVAGAIWMPSEEVIRLICFRSVSRYVFDLLSVSAGPGGAVGYPLRY